MIRRIEDPASALTSTHREALRPMMIEVCNRMVGSDITEYWERGSYFDEVSEWWVVSLEGEVIGWSGLKVMHDAPLPLIYIHSTGYVPEHQRHGLATLLAVEPWLRICARERRLMTMTYRTQSPIVVRACARTAGVDSYPWPSRGDDRKGRKARAAAAFTRDYLTPEADYDADLFVTREVFDYLETGSIYGTQPKSGERSLDAYFEDNVGPGDAVIGVMIGTPALGARFAIAWLRLMQLLRMLDVGAD